MIQGYAATQRLTGDAAVGTASMPVVVWSVTVLSGTSPTVALYNGPSVAGGTLMWDPATATAPTHWVFPNGKFFPSGCFADLGGTSPVVAVDFTQVG